MKVALLHTYYRQPGGEERVLEAEHALLERNGHEVVTFTADNQEMEAMTGLQKVTATVWNVEKSRELGQFLRAERPDVLHVHNTFPLLSPAVYHAAATAGVPVVQTLHNFRLHCLSYNFYRDGKACELCKGRTAPWPGVLHGCYRDSRAASAVVAAMLTAHNLLGTWQRKIAAFVVMSEVGRRKAVEGGLPAEKIWLKPHFLERDPGPGQGGGGFALFAGRLTKEKGVLTLIEAWRDSGVTMPLRIVGEGPLAGEVEELSRELPLVSRLGALDHSRVLALMGAAELVAVPSQWYETFGLVAMEALAKGTPVLTTEGTAPAELIEEGVTGWKVPLGDAAALRDRIGVIASQPAALAAMREEARRSYERRFAPEANLARLEEIYRSAIERPAPAALAPSR